MDAQLETGVPLTSSGAWGQGSPEPCLPGALPGAAARLAPAAQRGERREHRQHGHGGIQGGAVAEMGGGGRGK